MQVSIDSAKKSYDMNLAEEINRLKIDIDIDNNKYPTFWLGIRKDFSKKRINRDLICPMNCLHKMKIPSYQSKDSTLPMSTFFKKFELSKSDRIKKSKKMEEMIGKYSYNLYKLNGRDLKNEEDSILLLRDDFDNLIHDLRETGISNNYLGFMSWMIDKAFLITSSGKASIGRSTTKLNKNRAALLRVLYELNPSAVLKCFSNNVKTQ